jgi:hypothetical protein
VDTFGRIWEGDSVQLVEEEVRLMRFPLKPLAIKCVQEARAEQAGSRVIPADFFNRSARELTICTLLLWRPTVLGSREAVRNIRAQGLRFLWSLESLLQPSSWAIKSLAVTDRSQVFRLFRAIARKAGLAAEKQHPHALKHSIATHLVSANVNLALVKQQLGHKSVGSTMRYITTSDQQASKATTAALMQIY